jgi:hypothetical protein
MVKHSLLGGVLRESFLIHFRNLIEFLYAPRKFPTDSIAADYLDDVACSPSVGGYADVSAAFLCLVPSLLIWRTLSLSEISS